MVRFPIDYYDSARDMLDHATSTYRRITDEEARQILAYAVELEENAVNAENLELNREIDDLRIEIERLEDKIYQFEQEGI